MQKSDTARSDAIFLFIGGLDLVLMFDELKNLLEILCERNGIACSEECLTLSKREIDQLAEKMKRLESVVRFLKDDASAASYQSLGQYRTAATAIATGNDKG